MACVKTTLRCALIAVASLIVGTVASAKAATPDILQQVPSSARMCIVINNLGGFDHKIKALAGKMNLPIAMDPLAGVEQQAGISTGIDEHGSMAVVLMPPAPGHQHPAVLLFPITNFHQAFSTDHLTSVANGISTIQTPDGSTSYVAQHGTFAIVAQHESTLKSYLKSSGWGPGNLTTADEAAIHATDVAIYVNMPTIRKYAYAAIHSWLHMMDNMYPNQPTVPTISLIYLNFEAAIARQFLRQTTVALLTGHIGKAGVTLKITTHIAPHGSLAKLAAAQPILAAKPFVGLPADKFLALYACAINGVAFHSWANPILAKISQNKTISARSDFTQSYQSAKSILGFIAMAGHDQTLASTILAPTGTQSPLYKTIAVTKSGNSQKLLTKVLSMYQTFARQTAMKMPGMKLKVSVQPKAFILSGVTFSQIITRFIMTNTATAPQNAMVQGILSSVYGKHGSKTAFGALDATQTLMGINVSHRDLATAIAAVHANSDAIDSRPDIMAQAPYILPHPQMIAYLPIDSWLRIAINRMSAANGFAAAPNANHAPVSPVTLSAAIDGNQLAGEMFVPTSQLAAISFDAKRLMPMVMMSMMGGGGPPPGQ